MKNKFFVAVIFSTLLCSACDKEPEIQKPVFNQNELAAVQNVNKVAFDIFDKAMAEVNGGSLIVSPASISTLLGMEANTQPANSEAIMNMYGLGSLADANFLYNKLIDKYLYKEKSVRTMLSNAVFNNANIVADNAAADDVLKKYYYADIYSCDFSQPQDVSRKIVSWAKSKTNDMIDLKNVDVDDKFERIMVNAIYFKGLWKYPFKTENTRSRIFTTSDGSDVMLPTMTQTYRGQYISTDKYESAVMPYGNNSEYAMRIVLPKGDYKLDSDVWGKISAGNALREITVQLPKFETKFRYEPKIDGVNNFTMLHAAAISVDEAGSTAAAVTVGGDISDMPVLQVDFIVNKPFYYAITDTDTGLILFLGYFGGK